MVKEFGEGSFSFKPERAVGVTGEFEISIVESESTNLVFSKAKSGGLPFEEETQKNIFDLMRKALNKCK